MTEDLTPRIETLRETENFAEYQIEPLERGFGVTLGNALRRVLLSSLPGAAVTSIRVDGIYHEFDTVPGVKEDTTELILNIKQIRIKSHTDQPVQLRLMASGPGVVTASDLIYPAEVEIANPEQYLATLDGPDSRLEMELTVERGTGYLQSDGREPQALGIIPVDAIFTPVRRANYTIDQTRVGARADLERLTIELSTDGTIRPTEALALAANLLIDRFGIIADLTRGGRDRAKPSLVGGTLPPHIAEMPIEQLELSQRTYNCLKRSQITKVGQILELTTDDLLRLRNFGKKSLEELRDKLRLHNLTLSGTADEAGEDESQDGMGELDEEGEDLPDSEAEARGPSPFGDAEFEDELIDEESEEEALGNIGRRPPRGEE